MNNLLDWAIDVIIKAHYHKGKSATGKPSYSGLLLFKACLLYHITTPANVNEIANLEEVLDTVNLPKNIPLKTDKGYQSRKNEGLLKERKLKNHIMKKATRSQDLTRWELKFNKTIGNTRFKVERTFGGVKRWFRDGEARYKGLKKCIPKTYLRLCVTTDTGVLR